MNVEHIFLAATSGGPQQACERISVLAGKGIEGDRYFDRHDEPGQNLTLIEAEEIEAFLNEQQRPLDLSVTHRNLVTRGVRLNELVGCEFMIGEVRLRGVELCEPCMGMGQALASDSLTPAQVVKRLVGRGGLRADVLSDGLIERGAALRLLD
jgi:MOSC domain-containing protein YiiM